MKNNLKILVIGAGAIGGTTSAFIARSGYSIEIIDRFPELAKKISKDGIKVKCGKSEFTQSIKAYSDFSEITEKVDIILIATKVNCLASLSKNIERFLKDDSVIVSLQNGMCEEYLANRFGSERIIGCVVGWGATAICPGNLVKTSGGGFIIGTLNNIRVKHFDFVKEILSTTAPVFCTDNIHGYLYSKLIINACITTLGAICGLKLGKMLTRYKYRKIFIETIREAVNLARSKDIKLERYGGKIDFYRFADNNSVIANLTKHLFIFIFGLKYRKLKSSSLQSLQTGRKTEIDYLNGYIAEKARNYNLDTPVNNMLIKIVKDIENGMRSISTENINIFFKKHSLFNP